MKHVKSYFKLKYNGDVNGVNLAINNWLTNNGFTYIEKGENKYWRKGNPLVTKSFCIEYYIKETEVFINAYYNTPKKPLALENLTPGSNDYIQGNSMVEGLINQIRAGFKPSVGGDQLESSGALQSNIYEEMEKQANYQNSKSATIALVIAVINICLVYFLQISFGIIILIPAFIMAYRGLKSEKNTIAIIAMILIIFGLGVNIFFMKEMLNNF